MAIRWPFDGHSMAMRWPFDSQRFGSLTSRNGQIFERRGAQLETLRFGRLINAKHMDTHADHVQNASHF
eukprot:2849860-Lingulodinium_polyedra.AAC.1